MTSGLSRFQKPVCPERERLHYSLIPARLKFIRKYKFLFSQTALALLPEDAALLRSNVFLDLAGIYRNNDYEAAQTAYQEAINLGRTTGNLRIVMLGVYYLADLYLSLGQFQQAAQLYQQGLEWRRQIAPASALSCWIHAGLGALLYEWNELAEAIGRLRQALELAQQCGEVKVLMYARMTLAQALQNLIILALAQHHLGQAGQAVETMALAVSTAEPMGLIRTFADDPHPAVAALPGQVAARKGGSGYLSKLAALFGERPASAPPAASAPASPADQPLIEPLNEREIEVLRHISNGLSNQEIAGEMVLAVSTVKWYLRNIYDKLQVNRRTQALAKARELNLLSSN